MIFKVVRRIASPHKGATKQKPIRRFNVQQTVSGQLNTKDRKRSRCQSLATAFSSHFRWDFSLLVILR